MAYDPPTQHSDADRPDPKLDRGSTVNIKVSVETKDGVPYVLCPKAKSKKNASGDFKWSVKRDDDIEILTVVPWGGATVSNQRRGQNGKTFEATFTLTGPPGTPTNPVEVDYDLWYLKPNGDVCLAYGGTPAETPSACPQSYDPLRLADRGPNPPPETDFP